MSVIARTCVLPRLCVFVYACMTMLMMMMMMIYAVGDLVYADVYSQLHQKTSWRSCDVVDDAVECDKIDNN